MKQKMATRVNRGRVLVLTTKRTGYGHKAVAQAIQSQLRQQELSSDVEVLPVDPFDNDFWDYRLNAILQLYGPIIRRMPRIYGLAWRLLFSSNRVDSAIAVARRLIKPRLADLIGDARTQAVITTHPILPRLIAPFVSSNSQCIGVSVATDLGAAEPAYVSDAFSRYVAMTTNAALDLARWGAPDVKCVGYLSDCERLESARTSRGETRRELDVAPNSRLILIAGGRDGAGAMHRLTSACRRSLPGDTVLVACGTNRSLFKALRTRFASSRNVRPFLWTPKFINYLAAADIVLTKGGAATIMEAVQLAIPLVLVGYLPGQETFNAQYVRHNRLGTVTETVDEALEAAEELLQGQVSADSLQPLRASEGSFVELVLPELSRH